MKLHYFQEDVKSRVLAALRLSSKVVLQVPTGGGKTVVAANIIKNTKGRIWFVCHRHEIIKQASRHLSEFGVKHGVISRYSRMTSDRVQVISVQLLHRRKERLELPDPDLIFWDECHHMPAETWSGIMESYPNAKHLGLTATPERLDGRGLDQWFERLVRGPTIRQLIDDHHLSSFRYFAPSEPDLESVRVNFGDYVRADAAKVMDSPIIVGDALSEYKKHIDGKRALVFCISVKASKDLVAQFNAAGITSIHIDGSTEIATRDRAVSDLARGRIKVLSNVEVFTEGFDLPAIDAIFLMRPTRSLVLFLQMIGRGLRTSSRKKNTFIFDHSSLWMDHGMPDSNWDWSLQGNTRARRVSTAKQTGSRLRRCPDCSRVNDWVIAKCECGHAFERSRKVEKHDGFLREMDWEIPEGYSSRTKLAKLLGVSSWWIINATKRGMPTVDGWIPTKEAIEWFRQNPKTGKRNSTNDGYASVSQFSKLVKSDQKTIRRYLDLGLPHYKNGPIRLVRLDEGLRWVEQVRGLRRARKPAVKSPPPTGFLTINQYVAKSGLSYARVAKLLRRSEPKIWTRAGGRSDYKFPFPKNGHFNESELKLDSRDKQNGVPFGAPDEWVVGYKFALMFSPNVKRAEKRITRLTRLGLPRLADGRVHLATAIKWVEKNTAYVIPLESKKALCA